jgi:hypothetical protein
MFERRTMMKKLLVLALVLAVGSMASAALSIGGYDGSPLKPSDEVILSIVGDGSIAEPTNVFLTVEFAGGINGGAVVWASANPTASFYLDKAALDDAFGMDSVEAFRAQLGKQGINDVASANIASTAAPHPALEGLLVDGIVFHCAGPEDAIVTLYDANFGILDQVVIDQVPEPASMLLLGLGGLFLRRRK